MRLKIIKIPTGEIPGVSLDQFRLGGIYEVGVHVACVLVVEGWADIVAETDAVGAAFAPRRLVQADDRGRGKK